MDYYKIIDKCRICHSGDLMEVLKFNDQYLASTFVNSNRHNLLSTIKFPLTVLLCGGCGLVQLRETVNPDLLYRSYFYRTAVNDTMRRDLREVVREIVEKAGLIAGDYVVDIGANDCTMVSMFPGDLKRIAVEPAQNISWDHVDTSIQIVNDYFSKDVVLKASHGRKIKAITATAMFYDLDDPNKAVQDIKELLDEGGVCTIQVSYLYYTIRDMNFYDICHEHLEYYSLETINRLMERNGLSIFDAQTNFVNGGSLRVFITHQENARQKTESFDRILADERRLELKNQETWTRFSRAIDNLIDRARRYILSEIAHGGLVLGLGASTKGNVLLQLCGIDKKIIPYISERNEEKVGLRTLGTDIELISEQAAHKLKPSCMLVIPWNFKDEIVKREEQYLDEGGRLLFLMPYPYYVDKNGETRLE